MSIQDFRFACSIDNSLPYFTYEDNIMVIVNSKINTKLNRIGFPNIEAHIESIISHESIHAIIARLEGKEASDSLDDLEVIVTHKGIKFQVSLNNLAFAEDASGIVLT